MWPVDGEHVRALLELGRVRTAYADGVHFQEELPWADPGLWNILNANVPVAVKDRRSHGISPSLNPKGLRQCTDRTPHTSNVCIKCVMLWVNGAASEG
jgi:hypothetical protein